MIMRRPRASSRRLRNKTLKKEEVYLNQYQNFAEARANLGAFLEDVYNVKRLHSSLGYLPPTEFEQHFAENQTKNPTFTSKKLTLATGTENGVQSTLLLWPIT